MTLDAAEVEAIFKRQLALVRPMLADGQIVKYKACKEEPWPGFIASQSARIKIAPHVSEGEFPEALFRARAPNQTDAEFKWMRENFEHTTLPVYLDLENTVGRGLHETNWNLEIEDKEIKEHINGGIHEWGALFSFVKAALLKRKITDPMGVVTFLPSAEKMTEKVVVDAEGNAKMAADAKLYAEPVVYASDRVWGFSYDNWYLLRLEENSIIVEGNKSVPKGIVCQMIDSENVWHIRQVGRLRDWTFEVEIDYVHGIGEAPAIHMMGTPSAQDRGLVWTSPFSASAGLLNVALLTEHQLRASETKLMFPVRVMVGDPCDFYDQQHDTRCTDGKLVWYDEDRRFEKTCPSCNGSTHKNRISPFGELIINADPNSTKPDSVNASNALSYASPSTETSRFMREEVEKYVVAARSVMHLDAETPMSGGEYKTATQAGLNAKARSAFVKPICDQLFLIFDFGIRCTGKLLKGPEWDDYSLRVPVEYDLRTDADFLSVVSEADKSGMPTFVKSMLVNEFVTSRHADDPSMLTGIRALMMADRMTMMDSAAVASEISSGRATPWEVLLHYSGLPLLIQASEDESFEKMTDLEKAGRLRELAQENSAASGGLNNDIERLKKVLS